MEISVIIPMYNSQRTILRALESVYGQSYEGSKEVIVIDDGSNDNSLELVKIYKEKNKCDNLIIIEKENGGVSSARNAGLKIAKGHWIALLDSDDEWLSNKLDVQIKFLSQNRYIDFLGCNLVGKKFNIPFKNNLLPRRISTKDMLYKMHPQTSTVIFKSDILHKVGFYDETLRYGEDGNLWLRICHNFNCWFIPNQLVIFDGGKKGYGGAGLSGNLKEMQKGCRNLNLLALNQRDITRIEYLLLALYTELRYIRRKLLVILNHGN